MSLCKTSYVNQLTAPKHYQTPLWTPEYPSLRQLQPSMDIQYPASLHVHSLRNIDASLSLFSEEPLAVLTFHMRIAISKFLIWYGLWPISYSRLSGLWSCIELVALDVRIHCTTKIPIQWFGVGTVSSPCLLVSRLIES